MKASALAMVALVVALTTDVAVALDRFVGSYVGAGELVHVETGVVEERDFTTTIQRFGDGGFTIEWTTVVRVDGRRDLPGVRQFVRRLAFAPGATGRYYLMAPDYDPFRRRAALEPMAGDALAWATIEDDVLNIFVFAITEDGAGELQQHRRALTEAGLALEYLGLLDGRVITTGNGRLVRVE